MIAVSLDNFLFLLLIVVAALFQLLSKVLSKAGKSDSNETPTSPKPQTPRPIQRAPRESDADRIRKFLEALGQPPSSTPPPPVHPRTDFPPRPLARVQPPPVLTPVWGLPGERQQKPEVIQTESRPSDQPRRFQEKLPPPVPAPTTPAFEVHEALTGDLQRSAIIRTPVEAYAAPKAFEVAKGADFKMDIATLLGSRIRLREVILLREILGTPRGLQAMDPTS